MVYTIPCDQCPQCQAGWSLEQHLGEHHRALRKGDVLSSAVAEHVFTSGHQMDLSKARVMDSHPHTQTRSHWSPGTSNVSGPLSTERRTHCQNSTPLCWSDNATNWHRLSILWLPYYNYYYYLLLLHGIVSYYLATLNTFMLNTPAIYVFLLTYTSPLPQMTCHHLSSTLCLYSSAYVCASSLMKASIGNQNV